MAEIAAELGVSKSTVCYHLRKLGVPAKKQRRHDWAAIQEHYDEGHSVRECMEKFGFFTQTWNDAVRRGAVVPRPNGVPIGELLVAGRRRSRAHIKARLLTSGLKNRRCEECGLTEWRGRAIGLALHHVNGDGNDNRLENLQLLCPNCHSQTPNFGVRNWRSRRQEAA